MSHVEEVDAAKHLQDAEQAATEVQFHFYYVRVGAAAWCSGMEWHCRIYAA